MYHTDHLSHSGIVHHLHNSIRASRSAETTRSSACCNFFCCIFSNRLFKKITKTTTTITSSHGLHHLLHHRSHSRSSTSSAALRYNCLIYVEYRCVTCPLQFTLMESNKIIVQGAIPSERPIVEIKLNMDSMFTQFCSAHILVSPLLQ